MTKILRPLLLSLLLLLLHFFFFISNAAEPIQNSTNCPSYYCGDVLISYPFWRIDDTTLTAQFCGYSGFGINCSGEDAIIRRPDDSYYVQDINYEHRNLTLVDIDVTTAGNCPRVRNNIDLVGLPVIFSALNVNLSFHFNCTEIPDFATVIPCLESGDKLSCVHIVRTGPEGFDWGPYGCGEEVVATVMERAVNRRDRMAEEFSTALNGGFELNWQKMENCGSCEDSGGRCGYNHQTGEDMCFCSDGRATTDDCKKGSRINWRLKLVIGFSAAGFSIFMMCLIFYFYQKRNRKRYYGSSYMSRNISSYTSSMTDLEKDGTYHGVQIFKYSELEKATNSFDSKNELGDGGFGTVYRGKLRDGRIVAVKRLYENNYKRVEQFMNEVEILAHLRHQNLVSLYGCTTHHSRELLLVYEYIPNGTVADHLHGERTIPGSLTWTTRMSIAIESASALAYLHASDVIHRDVKSNNILLDSNFCVKVADFGLSRLFPNDVTHVSTAPQGTPGYVDPVYHECYHLTKQSDVYSFGVVLVELISSKPAVDITRHRHEINLSNMAINKIRNNELHELVDPHIGFESDYEVRKMVTAVAELAFQCLQTERDSRPSMDEVLRVLKEIQGGEYNKEKKNELDGTCDDAVLLKNHPQNMSPDSVAVTWSTSTLSNSSG